MIDVLIEFIKTFFFCIFQTRFDESIGDSVFFVDDFKMQNLFFFVELNHSFFLNLIKIELFILEGLNKMGITFNF